MISPGARIGHLPILALIALSTHGCTQVSGFLSKSRVYETSPTATATATAPKVESVEQVDLFRRAETERAAELTREIARLQYDLRKAEEALIQAESGLAASHTRADAVSSLAVATIQVERAATRAPWRGKLVEDARSKLHEAEKQVAEGRFGAALFFVYRSQRVAESLLHEADLVERTDDARIIHARRVNLRAGPSTNTSVLSVLEAGTPVFPRAQEGEWMLMQVIGGPTGWIHRNLVSRQVLEAPPSPASPKP
jgi:Bacterial SH3 domain